MREDDLEEEEFYEAIRIKLMVVQAVISVCLT